MFTQRFIYLYAFLVCVGLMGTALTFQYVLHLEPCPLCILQRVVVISLGLLFVLAALHNPGGTGRSIYGILTAMLAVTGLGIAGWQVRLQHLPPDQVPECGPGLDYMLEVMPLKDILVKVFRGSGECAEVLWTFLGLSIPEWMLVVFSAFILFGIYQIFFRPKAS
jgi:disulfide bond formation protein DsbB